MHCIAVLDVLISLSNCSRCAEGVMCRPELEVPKEGVKVCQKVILGHFGLMQCLYTCCVIVKLFLMEAPKCRQAKCSIMLSVILNCVLQTLGVHVE